MIIDMPFDSALIPAVKKKDCEGCYFNGVNCAGVECMADRRPDE